MLTSSDFNKRLISALNETMCSKSKQVIFLMETIHIGKEAAYRRLRYEVPFTFNEAGILACKLNISLDKIIYQKEPQVIPSFQIYTSLYGFNKDYKCYYNDEYNIVFDKLMQDHRVTMISAYHTIPHTFLFLYKNLSRFRAFKWHYEQNKESQSCKFSSIQISKEVFETHKNRAHTINYFPEQTLIITHNLFSRLINEINYFRDIFLITKEEIVFLKEELFDLIERLETCAVKGETFYGKKLLLYLSNVDFDIDCTYVKGEKYEISFIHIYQMNALASMDIKVCEMQKDWIESLRKYSTLITMSGESERIRFFETQRRLVSAL